MRNNHDKKTHKLGKRTFALCLALAVICSCLLPVFATGNSDAAVMLPEDGGIAMPVAGDDSGAVVQPGGGEIAMPVIPGDGEGTASSGSESGSTPVTDPSSVKGVTFPEGATNIVKNPNGSYSYDTAYGRVTVFPDADKADMGDGTVKPNPNLKEDDAAFGVLPITYHFWLKKMDSFDLDDLTWEAEMADLSETEYLSLYGSSKKFPIWHMDTISADDVMGNYTFNNPTSLNDPEGKGREFAGWYTVDSLGVESEFEFYKSYGDESNTTINVFAKWKDASGDVVEEPKTDDTKSEETKDETKQEETKADDTKKNETAKAALTAEAALPDTDAKATITVEGMPASATHLSVTTMGDTSMENFYNLYTELGGKLMPLMGFKITPKDASGATVQPNGYVTVTISGLGGIGLETLSGIKVLHQTIEHKVETLDALYDSATGTLTFLTNSFSPFVIAYPEESGVKTLESVDGGRHEISNGGSITLQSSTSADKINNNGWKWTIEDDTDGLLTLSDSSKTSVTVKAAKANTSDTTVTVKHTYTVRSGKNTTDYTETYTIVVKGTSTDTTDGHWVYIYVQTDKASATNLGLVVNDSGWFTVGRVWVSNMEDPTDQLTNYCTAKNYHFYNESESGTHTYYDKDKNYHEENYSYSGDNWSKVVDADGKLIGKVDRYSQNQNVQLDNVNWSYKQTEGKNDYGLIVGNGADDYVSISGSNNWIPSWHLDGYLFTQGKVTIQHYVIDEYGNEIYLEGQDDMVPGAIGDVVDAAKYVKPSVTYKDESYTFAYYGDSQTRKIEQDETFLKIYYKRSTASLTVSKTVTGLLGERDADFNFTLYVKSGVGTNNVTYKKNGGDAVALGESKEYDSIDGGEYRKYNFMLKHGESITFNGLPTGTYYVAEDDYSDKGYTTTITGANESADNRAKVILSKDGNAAVTFTNDRTIDVDTGVILDTLPYIVILAVVVGGGVMLFLRKRRKDDED